MPQFCRHNRLIQNCAICAREQAIEPRPLVSSAAPRTHEPRPRAPRTQRRGGAAGASKSAGLTVRRLRETADDGYRSPLVPGLKSSEEGRRLAEELAFADTRLSVLASDPPGLYAEVADPSRDLEERTWLAFLIAYLAPLEDPADPFASIRAVRTPWASGELPDIGDVETGPRTAHDPARGGQTIAAYKAWAHRAGSQARAVVGEASWSPQRRFARIHERLALPGLDRAARFEFLVSLGVLGVYELEPVALVLGDTDEVSLAAKRALGIGDPLLLERRAGQLAAECQVRLAALDLGLYNWERGERARVGLPVEVGPDPEVVEAARRALGVATSET
jgi:hypothetical protein